MHRTSAIEASLTKANIPFMAVRACNAIFLEGDTSIQIHTYGKDKWAITRQFEGDDIIEWTGVDADIIDGVRKVQAMEAA
jgi:hypothetical protein